MRRLVLAAMAAGVIALSACSNKTEQKNDSGQKVNAGIREADESGAIRTESELDSLLKSVTPGEAQKNVALVGLLHVGAFSSIKADPSQLTIGKTSLIVWMNHSDREQYNRQATKYDGKTVLIKAEIYKPDPRQDPDFGDPLIVNVQEIELVK